MTSQTLEPLGDEYSATREALHRVAEGLVAPARKPPNEIALRATEGGFGTPVFEYGGKPWQVRVEAADLVVREGAEERRDAITSLAAGSELIGTGLFPDGPPSDAEPLGIDSASARALGAWYALGDAVLGELAAEWGADDPNLWPEHFDLAIEAGDEAAGQKANYGFSPGDENHDEPYLYVGPWSGEVSGELWNADGFAGAEIGYAELAAADDPRAAALEFCRARKSALEGN
jgi:hypothetical protein